MNERHLSTIIRKSKDAFSDFSATRIKRNGQWEEMTYKELGEKIDNAAKALLDIGIKPGDMVGIFSENTPEWAIADFSILSTRAVSVPIYATNTSKQAEYIVNDAKLKAIYVGNQGQYDKILEFFDSVSFLTTLIVTDESVPLKGDHSIYLKDFIEKGNASQKDDELFKNLDEAKEDELATLIYTSGTTGDPKGVMLTHKNFIHQIEAVRQCFSVGTTDKSLSFLPLSHAYERTWNFCVYNWGVQNNYLADPKQVVEAMSEVRPTAMVSVPRLYEKIYATVYDRIEKASGLKKGLFTWAVNTGKKYNYKKYGMGKGGPLLGLKYSLADKLILSKLRDIVGGPKNFFSAGGAPLAKEIEEFFFAAGLLVCQGYGLTETAPMLTFNYSTKFRFGTVGSACPGVTLKIADSGEILAKGDNIMVGYYNKPDATAEAIVDGWFHTGDVGVIDEDGFLRITDRIKDLIITAQGKNIAPQRIEMMVGQDHYIETLATIGDKRKYISALIVPSFENLEGYAKDNGIEFSSREDLIKNPEIIEFYEKRIADQSVELAGYEKIKRFTLLSEEFTQEAGLITPTLKIKRKAVSAKYNDLIDAMYAD